MLGIKAATHYAMVPKEQKEGPDNERLSVNSKVALINRHKYI